MSSEQVPVPAKFVMFLGVGKQDHENQSHQGTSGDDGRHSSGLAHYALTPEIPYRSGKRKAPLSGGIERGFGAGPYCAGRPACRLKHARVTAG